MAVDADVSIRELTESADEPDTNVDVDLDAVDESETTVAETKSRSPVKLTIVAGLVIVLTLGALVAWLGWRTFQAHSVQKHEQTYLQAARQGALNLTTIDFTNADADIQRILDSSTGNFHDDFQSRSQPFVDAIKQAQSKSEGTVTAAGLESMGDHEAQALVAVTVKSFLAGKEQPQPRAWRMRITVQDVDNQVKVSNVAFVS